MAPCLEGVLRGGCLGTAVPDPPRASPHPPGPGGMGEASWPVRQPPPLAARERVAAVGLAPPAQPSPFSPLPHGRRVCRGRKLRSGLLFMGHPGREGAGTGAGGGGCRGPGPGAGAWCWGGSGPLVGGGGWAAGLSGQKASGPPSWTWPHWPGGPEAGDWLRRGPEPGRNSGSAALRGAGGMGGAFQVPPTPSGYRQGS